MEKQEQLVQELAWLRRVAVRLVGDDAAAGDLTQEVALEALRKPPTIEGLALEGARLRGWLWTVARRKAGRRRERAASQAWSESKASRPDAVDDTTRSVQQLEVHRALLDEISALDANDGRLITQRYLDRQPPREMARTMGLPVATVRKRLSRAMERLRQRLVESERGADGWSLGLCLIVGSHSTPGPLTNEPRAHGSPHATASMGGTTLVPWASVAVVLVAAAATWWWLSPSTTSESRAATVPLAQGDPTEPETARTGDVAQAAVANATARQRIIGEPTALAPETSLEPATIGKSTLRFVDEAGRPLSAARAVWADEDWTPLPLEIDADGVAELPQDARGLVYAGANGYENQRWRLEWSERQDMQLTLQPQRRIPGQILIDGLPPGRKITLWRSRGQMNHWPVEINSDDRMQAVLREHGLAWTQGVIETDPDGGFEFTTRASWPGYSLELPAEFELVRASGFRTATPGKRRLSFERDSDALRIEVVPRACVTGRIVWADDRQPYTGLINMFPTDSDGKWMAEVRTLVDQEGRFQVPVVLERPYRRGSEDPWHGLELLQEGVVITHPAPHPGEVHDLGIIEIPRAPLAHFQLRVDAGDGKAEPVTAAVASASEEALTDEAGIASVHAAAGSKIRVLAEGYGYREVTVERQAHSPATPQVIELRRNPRLGVRFSLGDRSGFDPDKSVNLVLRMAVSAFEGDHLSKRASERFWTVYRRLGGKRVKYFRSAGDQWKDGKGQAFLQAVPDRDLWVDGLRPGSTFDVELQDILGQTLVQKTVTMPLNIDAPQAFVDFGDLYEAGAAAVELSCSRQNGEPFNGQLYIGRVDQPRVQSLSVPENGRLSLGPLLPGAYAFTEGSRGTPRQGEGEVVTLQQGANLQTLRSVDVPSPR
jgi:RNA polymerase sigma-70 factor (ECF subfamily)